MENSESIFVHDKGNVVPVVREIEFTYVPFDLRSNVRKFLAGEIEICESLKLRLAVGADAQAIAMLREADGPCRGSLGAISAFWAIRTHEQSDANTQERRVNFIRLLLSRFWKRTIILPAR
jgi:hypothetical protein